MTQPSPSLLVQSRTRVGDRRSGSGRTTERATTILKEPFHLPPLFLGRPAESCRKTDSGPQRFPSRPGVLLWQGQIFEELIDEFGAHALIQPRQHFDCAKNPSGENGDHLAHADIARRLHVVAAHLYVAGMAG